MSEEKTVNKKLARRIIYVDASFNNEINETKISLYDKEINKLDTLILIKPTNSNEAEKYAILYACLYTKKKNIDMQRVHILNDNQSATKDEKILDICKYFGVNISWIPREVNVIADNGTKLEVNIKLEESNILEVFYDIVMNKCTSTKEKDTVVSLNNKKDMVIVPKVENVKNILMNALRHTKIKDKPYVSLGQVGKFLMEKNPTFKFTSLKKEIEKYQDDFVIVNNNYVKIK